METSLRTVTTGTENADDLPFENPVPLREGGGHGLKAQEKIMTHPEGQHIFISDPARKRDLSRRWGPYALARTPEEI